MGVVCAKAINHLAFLRFTTYVRFASDGMDSSWASRFSSVMRLRQLTTAVSGSMNVMSTTSVRHDVGHPRLQPLGHGGAQSLLADHASAGQIHEHDVVAVQGQEGLDIALMLDGGVDESVDLRFGSRSIGRLC